MWFVYTTVHTHMIASDITYYISSVKASVNSNLLGLCSFFDVNDLKLSLMYLMDQKYLHMAASDTFLKDYMVTTMIQNEKEKKIRFNVRPISKFNITALIYFLNFTVKSIFVTLK